MTNNTLSIRQGKGPAKPKPTNSSSRNNNKQLTRVPRSPSLKPLANKVCGLTDPFCTHARGACYPDDSSVLTIPYSFHDRFPIITDVTGGTRLAFWPQYKYMPNTYFATGTAPQVDTWANFALAPTVGAITKYRIVSCGLILRRVSPMLTTSGMVHIRGYGFEDGSNMNGVVTDSYMGTTSLDIPLADCHETAIVLQHSSQMAQTFYDSDFDDSNIGFMGAKGFCPISIYLEGCPASSTCLDVEYYIHYEVVMSTDTATSFLARPPPPANPVITAAAAKITSSTKSFFSDGVAKLGTYIAEKAMVAVATAIAGPTAGVATNLILDID